MDKDVEVRKAEGEALPGDCLDTLNNLKLTDAELSKTQRYFKELMAAPPVVFTTAIDAWVEVVQGEPLLDSLLRTERAVKNSLLMALGANDKEARLTIKIYMDQMRYPKVSSVDTVPGAGLIVPVADRDVLNLWVPPVLKPVEGDCSWPLKLLARLTGNDPKALEWYLNWLAAKVQNPALRPETACVFRSEEGAGKGTLKRMIGEIGGRQNTAQLTPATLRSRFTPWVGKPWIFGEEAATEDRFDLENELKAYITEETIRLEKKGIEEKSIPNRTAWHFFSNNDIPVKLGKTARRFTVFNDNNPVEPEWSAWLKGLYTPEKSFTAEALAGISAFAHFLQNVKVDHQAVSTAFDNRALRELIKVNLGTLDTWANYIEENGPAVSDLLHYFTEENTYEETRRGYHGAYSGDLLWSHFKKLCEANNYQAGGRKHFDQFVDNRRGWIKIGRRNAKSKTLKNGKRIRIRSGFWIPRSARKKGVSEHSPSLAVVPNETPAPKIETPTPKAETLRQIAEKDRLRQTAETNVYQVTKVIMK